MENQDTPAIPTEQQMSLIESLVKSGVLTPDAIQSHAAQYTQDNPSPSANVDLNTLQSLIKHAVNPNAVPMQDGDKVHPMDAINQIGQSMAGQTDAGVSPTPLGPAAPAGVQYTGGPQITRRSDGSLQANTITSAPIGRLLGIHEPTSVTGPNFFGAAQQAGVDRFLPNGLMSMPDGTPYVDQKSFTDALNASRATLGQGNQVFTTKDQLTSQGIPEDVASSLMAANPKGVSTKEISNYLGSERLKSQNVMANARATMAGVAKLGQALKVGGFDAAQPMAEAANKNLGNVQRAQAAIDQIVAAGGIADQRQRSELASSIAQIASNSQGVLTDERMNQFLPQSAKGKFGNVYEYWSNERQPVDFTGFLPQLQDLLIREKGANQGISNAASQLGINIMGASGQPGAATSIAGARNNSPIFGAGQTGPVTPPVLQPSPAAVPPGDQAAQAYLQKINAKNTPANLAWAKKKLGI